MRFKKGDRVRIIKDDVDDNKYLGKEATIITVGNTFYWLDLDVGSLFKDKSSWADDELELIA
jgi:hypothetical protein